jgi:S1-C subfamily serine protease
VGDVILRLNDKDVGDLSAAAGVLRSLKPGDKLSIKAKRGDKELTADATLDKK